MPVAGIGLRAGAGKEAMLKTRPLEGNERQDWIRGHRHYCCSPGEAAKAAIKATAVWIEMNELTLSMTDKRVEMSRCREVTEKPMTKRTGSGGEE